MKRLFVLCLACVAAVSPAYAQRGDIDPRVTQLIGAISGDRLKALLERLDMKVSPEPLR